MIDSNIKRAIFFALPFLMVALLLPIQAPADEMITVTGVLKQANDDIILDTGKKKMLVEIEADNIMDLMGKTIIATGSMDKDEKDRDVFVIEKYEVKE